MKSSEKNSVETTEELVLEFEISEQDSELIKRLSRIITTQKLPKEKKK